MAITIDWPTGIISIPKADTQLVQSSPTEIRQLDLDTFRKTLKDLEDDEEGMPWPTTHNHVQPIDVGGVTLARVVEIINGYTVTFEDGQYAVNLVGANSNVGDVVNVNQVSVRTANSAGLTFSKASEDTAFADARVWIDTTNGLAGTGYPRGTVGDPVNNLADAQTIIAIRSLPKRIHLMGTLVVGASDDISGYNILGESVVLSSVDVTTGANTTDLVIEDCMMTGDLNGNVTARRATSFQNLDDFDGSLHGTGLGGTVTLELGSTAHEFIDCYSEEGGQAAPIVDCQSMVDPEIYFRRYSGSVEIHNFTSGVMTLGFTEGRAILDSSCTGGTIVIRGDHVLEDNSNGSTIVREGNSANIEGIVIPGVL